MAQLQYQGVVKQKVEAVWARVFQTSNRVIKQARDYGFLGIELIPSPNIHQIVVQLQVFDFLIDTLLANSAEFDLEYEQVRQLHNAKKQLVNMGRVASALKAENKADFDEAIAELEGQAML